MFGVNARTLRIDLHSKTALRVVRCGLVIQHRIPEYSHTMSVSGMNHLNQLCFGSPFGASRVFLLKLAQVVEIVGVVAVTSVPASFAAGRNPHVVDTDSL